ncbi:hypothetical protein MK489_06080 [Myxococcota bacterium]|nr:hypothetical protein [Myxococcota bacterium]
MFRWLNCSISILGMVSIVWAAQAMDRGADGRFDKRESAHFVLLQDVDIDETSGLRGSRRFEQEVLQVLESAYERIDDLLGLRPSRRIKVTIYDPAVFDAQFAGLFRFPAAGFYAGVIRIRGDTVVHDQLVRVLTHELVHASLDMEAPSRAIPAWLNEGLAEWLEARTLGKRRLSPWEHGRLASALKAGRMPPLQQLSGASFAQLSGQHARLAYLESYAFVEFLVRRYGERDLKEFVRVYLRTGDLNRSLKRVYRADLKTLEKRHLDELR